MADLIFIFLFYFGMLFVFLAPFFIAIVIIAILYFENKKKREEYKRSSYYNITNIPYECINMNKGRYGEYLMYRYLKKFESNGAKLLFNLYIPKGNDETTEIDALMICSRGVFVFESKNYSGWVFGSETQKYWYQTLAAGRRGVHKKSFYNPVLQNNTHIKCLKNIIGEETTMQSFVLFSNRCTLKNVKIYSENIHVINVYKVTSVIENIFAQSEVEILDENRINEFYDKLYPYSQVSNEVKLRHVVNIREKYNKNL